ncbi:MAG TPA: Hpt domain-containing protein [Nitrospiraceae bacterium]|nr:Hpt domain-containing protein [Nitrospiraceae bacterium]
MNHSPRTNDDQKIFVRIDPDLADLIPGFLNNRRADVMFLREAAERRDFEAVRMAGHRLRGDGGGYGFPDISRVGAALEQAGKDQDSSTIHRHIMELSTYLDRVEVIYD